MKTSLIFLQCCILIIIPVICINAQTYNIQGVIIDTNFSIDNAVDFANVGIIGKNFGTVSNDSGRFSLDIPIMYSNDSITFSKIGYYSKNIIISELLKEQFSKVILVPKIFDLPEVQINSNRLRSHVKGNKSRSRNIVMVICSDTILLGVEYGIVINLPDKQVFIKDFNLHVLTNNPDSVKFRLNIYNYSGDTIGENMLKRNIFFTIPGDHQGDFSVDLNGYNLSVSNDIFMAIEKVAVYVSQENINMYPQYSNARISISASLIGSKTYYRKVSLGNWEEAPKMMNPGFWITYLQ